jgi:tetratricopeptide (TPR) repeat protein
MKKIIYIFLIALTTLGCSNEIEVINIPLTSSSDEAKDLFISDVVSVRTGYRMGAPQVLPILDKIFELDSKFYLANALRGSYNNNLNSGEKRKLITEAYDNRDSVSEIEKALITSIYEQNVSRNLVKAESALNDITNKYPDYYYLWLYTGSFQNMVLLDPDKSELSWEKALKLDPNNSMAKILLSQLHYVTTVDFQLLTDDKIDLEKAISLIESAEKNDQKNYTYSRLLGNIYRARGEFDKSLDAYSRATSLIENKESSAYKQTLLVSGHNYLFKEEYEKTREIYRSAIAIDYRIGFDVNISRWLANTYLYEKKYNQAIKEIDLVENRIVADNTLDEIGKNIFLYRCDFERFITYGHSQMKEDAFESLQNMIGHQEDLKKLEASSATNNDEIRRIGLNIDINNEFNKIWYLILFGEFEEAANELKSFSLLSSEYLVYDSKAMINFYKLSGYLNLMSGNLDASISFYDQIPRALLEADNYQLYFYALAVNAKGKKDKSNELFTYLANYNFAGWENSIIRSLAQAQLDKV